jgi:AraC-like DNA-binding protein
VAQNLGNLALPARCAGTHVLARDRDFVVEDCVCCLPAESPAVERVNRRTAIAVVLRGSFHVGGSDGSVLASSGTLLLKNRAATHVYRHLDDGGDRSLTFELDDSFVDDRRFARIAIPASPRTAAAVAAAERALAGGDPEELRDAAYTIASLAFAADGTDEASPIANERRIARVLRYIDADPSADCTLDTLAAIAGLARFHFARSFRSVVGQTPRQYVIAMRLRAAATALASTNKPVTEIALDAGFADLSNFTTTFRRAFGVSPRRYRRYSPTDV